MIFKGGIFLSVAICLTVVLLICLSYMIYKSYTEYKPKIQTTTPQPTAKTKVSLRNFKKSIGEFAEKDEFDVRMNEEHMKDIEKIYVFIYDNDEAIRGLLYDATYCIAMDENGKSDKSSSKEVNEVLLDFYPGQKVNIKGFKNYLKAYVLYLNTDITTKDNQNSFIEATYYLKACSKGEYMKYLKKSSLEKDLKKNNLIPKDFKYSSDYISNQRDAFIVCILSNLYNLAIGFCNKPPED